MNAYVSLPLGEGGPLAVDEAQKTNEQSLLHLIRQSRRLQATVKGCRPAIATFPKGKAYLTVCLGYRVEGFLDRSSAGASPRPTLSDIILIN